ncbi:Npun_R2821/Npun_R2822 family protein [Lyngbya aestuarii]|uniref:Npun_R2821/Npun_R2822 family protein n=1 Tax=Lyngbya aestuarii TaxID=118322 RepID=UPI00403DDBDC
MTNGIYTVANDVVYDQLVALLNSIEINTENIPVCVIAYDDKLEKIRQEIATRSNVTLLEDSAIFARWEKFSAQIWQTHPTALTTWQARGIQGVYRLGMNRRYCAFDPDSPFEKFIYFDADVLVFNSLEFIFKQLNNSDFVVYDFQFKDPSHIYNLQSSKLNDIFEQSRLQSEIFCAGFYGAKRGLLPEKQRELLISHLNQGEADILYMSAPNQSVLNYLIMRSGIPVYNFALNLPENQRTGNSVTSPHFENRNHVLFDKGNRLTYLHYIGLNSLIFQEVCQGRNIGFPYRDLFLHYRYLREPEKQPKFQGKPKPYNAPPSLLTRVLHKLGLHQS